MNSEESFFEKFGLEIGNGAVEVGQVYPIYGMITKFISDDLGNVVVEINRNINMKLQVTEEDKLELLKERSFEPGIFVAKILSVNEGENIEADCATVVFGRKQHVEV